MLKETKTMKVAQGASLFTFIAPPKREPPLIDHPEGLDESTST